MHPQDEQPGLARLELLGHLAAAARLAMAESPSADGLILTIEVGADGTLGVDCQHLCGEQPVSGWGQ